MIQRQQTLWLLLATAFAVLSFQFPFYSGTVIEENMPPVFTELEGGSNLWLILLTAISAIISLIAIFLFKDRSTQLKLVITGIVVSAVLLILYFKEVTKFHPGNFALTSVFIFLLPITFILAARGIRKDQKLIKSLDKLR